LGWLVEGVAKGNGIAVSSHNGHNDKHHRQQDLSLSTKHLGPVK
jgi:hypothetical protein